MESRPVKWNIMDYARPRIRNRILINALLIDWIYCSENDNFKIFIIFFASTCVRFGWKYEFVCIRASGVLISSLSILYTQPEYHTNTSFCFAPMHIDDFVGFSPFLVAWMACECECRIASDKIYGDKKKKGKLRVRNEEWPMLKQIRLPQVTRYKDHNFVFTS